MDEHLIKKHAFARKRRTKGGGPVPLLAANRKDNGAIIKLEQNHKHGNIIEPVTPTRIKRDSTDGKVTPGRTSSNSRSMSTMKSTPHKRNVPGGAAAGWRGVPEEAGGAGRVVFALGGQVWAVIREKWTEMTGIETAYR